MVVSLGGSFSIFQFSFAYTLHRTPQQSLSPSPQLSSVRLISFDLHTSSKLIGENKDFFFFFKFSV